MSGGGLRGGGILLGGWVDSLSKGGGLVEGEPPVPGVPTPLEPVLEAGGGEVEAGGGLPGLGGGGSGGVGKGEDCEGGGFCVCWGDVGGGEICWGGGGGFCWGD